MVDSRRPRIVLVTRKSGLELLLEQHGTIGQVRFAAGPASSPALRFCRSL